MADVPVSLQSKVIALLISGHRPMGHWLLEVSTAYGCKSLAGLKTKLIIANAKKHGRAISYDLL
jgi:hypothetical protein